MITVSQTLKVFRCICGLEKIENDEYWNNVALYSIRTLSSHFHKNFFRDKTRIRFKTWKYKRIIFYSFTKQMLQATFVLILFDLLLVYLSNFWSTVLYVFLNFYLRENIHLPAATSAYLRYASTFPRFFHRYEVNNFKKMFEAVKGL